MFQKLPISYSLKIGVVSRPSKRLQEVRALLLVKVDFFYFVVELKFNVKTNNKIKRSITFFC